MGEWFAGTDLVAFTKRWWLEHGSEFPDMVLACECWDLVMRNLIKIHGGIELFEAIYHEIHHAWWYWSDNFKNNPGNHWNRKLSTEFFRARSKDGADENDWRKEIERRKRGPAIDHNLRELQKAQALMRLPFHDRIVSLQK